MTARVLIVDDLRPNIKMLEATLLAEYFEVVSATTGREALTLCQDGKCDIVLLDVVMPGLDGIELAKRAADLSPALKIMFITGFAAVALNADSAAPKHAKVLSKPVHLRDLVNEVHKMLAA